MTISVIYDDEVFCSQRVGGVSRYFADLMNGLSESAEVEIDCTARVHINRHLSGVRPLKSRYEIRKQFKGAGRVARALNSFVRKVDLRPKRNSIGHYTWYPTSPTLTASTTVVTLYDLIHERFSDLYPDTGNTRERKAHWARNADLVVCISESTARDAIEYLSVPADRLRVIPLCLSERFASLPVSTHDQWPVRSNYILYVGVRGRHKNFSTFLTALSRLPRVMNDYTLLLFGGGELSKTEAAEVQSACGGRLRIEHMHGDDDLLIDAYRRSALFVYPSLWEGFGLPLLEAMATGCPIATSITSSMPEVCGPVAEYFDPTDADSIASTIDRVLNDPSAAQIRARLGRERVIEYSRSALCDRTLSVYKELSS